MEESAEAGTTATTPEVVILLIQRHCPDCDSDIANRIVVQEWTRSLMPYIYQEAEFAFAAHRAECKRS